MKKKKRIIHSMKNCSQFQRLLYFTMEENCISGLFLFKLTLLANDSDCLPKVCYLKLKKLRYLSKLRLSESVGASDHRWDIEGSNDIWHLHISCEQGLLLLQHLRKVSTSPAKKRSLLSCRSCFSEQRPRRSPQHTAQRCIYLLKMNISA